MIPNFNIGKWDREKIIDYVIGEQPLDDQQLEFLNYFEQLQQENKKMYCQLEQSKNFIKMIKDESYQSSVIGICEIALEKLGE